MRNGRSTVKDFRLYDKNSSSKGRLPAAHIAQTSRACIAARVGVDYKSPITITVPIKLSITITVVIEKAITITIIRLRLQLLVYHGNDSRLFIRHVHLQYYHA